MKPVLQALLIAPGHEARTAILGGRKAISIREGHRDYQPGLLMLVCHIEPWVVMAKIPEGGVRHCLLSEITEQEYRDDGYDSLEKALEDLKRFYPNMTMDSPVTVIRWKVVEDKDNFFWFHREVYATAPEELYSFIEVKQSF